MYDFFGPFKRMSLRIIGRYKAVDGFSEFSGGGKGSSFQGISAEKREPHFNLVHPACVCWDKMEMNILVSRQPHIPLGFMRAQVIHNDMNFPLRVTLAGTSHSI